MHNILDKLSRKCLQEPKFIQNLSLFKNLSLSRTPHRLREVAPEARVVREDAQDLYVCMYVYIYIYIYICVYISYIYLYMYIFVYSYIYIYIYIYVYIHTYIILVMIIIIITTITMMI